MDAKVASKHSPVVISSRKINYDATPVRLKSPPTKETLKLLRGEQVCTNKKRRLPLKKNTESKENSKKNNTKKY